MKVNEHYFELKDSYLFATVGKKTAEYKKAHPDKDVGGIQEGASR